MRELTLGRFTLAAGEKPPKRPAQDEIGGTGTAIYSGFISDEEYNADLRGSLGRAVYDKMRRSDGQVKATLLACTLPIHAATWTMEPGSDSPKDRDIASLLERNLFDGMTITWQSFLSHALLMLPFGFSMCEKVWELRDGRYEWRKLAPRLPKTLYKWDFDEHGGLRGVYQHVWIGSDYKEVYIPSDKLLVFTNEKEGSNFEGVSLLRAAYKHWYFKDRLYRIDGIAAERHAVGLPVFHYPATASKDMRKNLDEMGQMIQAHERMYLRLPKGGQNGEETVDFELAGLTGTIRDVMPSIEHHDRMISRSVLAQFLNLGSGEIGSWALARDQSSFFLMALRAVATNICDTFNRYAIPQWVEYNVGPVDAYPQLTVSGLETRDVETYGQAIVSLVQAGVLTPGRELEESLRGFLHLPELPEEEGKPEGEPAATQLPSGDVQQTALNGAQIASLLAIVEQVTRKMLAPETAIAAIKASFPTLTDEQTRLMVESAASFAPDPASLPQGNLAKNAEWVRRVWHGKERRRELTNEEKLVALDEIESTLDRAQQEMVGEAGPVQKRIINNLLDAVEPIVKNRQFDKLENIEVRYRSQIGDILEKMRRELYEYGKKTVREEMRAQGAKAANSEPITPDDEAFDAMMNARTRAATAGYANKLRNYVTFEALRQMKKGVWERDELSQGLVAVSKNGLDEMAGYTASETFNYGRREAAREFATDIAYVQYSAILDGNACEVCAPMNGKEWPYDDPRTEMYASGNPDCLGRGRCRCVLIYVHKGETPSEVE